MSVRPKRDIFILLLPLLSLVLASYSFAANPHWVSPTGTATWANAQSATPLSGTACASLATANANASAGDLVYLRSGTYADAIHPSNSGTSSNKIIWQAYNFEVVTLGCDNAVDSYYYGIFLDGVNYHVIRDLEIDGGNADNVRLVVINNGASYNELDNLVIHGGARNIGNSGIHIYDAGGNDNGSKNNWIHNCVIYDAGYISSTCNDNSNLIKIGNYNDDYISDSNTIESCILYWGGHHVLETYTKYNVIRNNILHNECWMLNTESCTPAGTPCPEDPPKWGNRNIQVYDGNNSEAMYNLIEGNRIGHAGPPPDGNGANNLVLTSPANIVRYNYIYNAGEKNIHLKQGTNADSDNNRIYNNTCYKTTGIRPTADGIFCSDYSDNNYIKNNIFYSSYDNDIGLKCIEEEGNYLFNNWTTSNGDPKFYNTDVSNPMSKILPDLTLRADSNCIDAGTYLTQANGSGSNSTTLVVDDALYFQDGSWGSPLSDVQADWIAIGNVDKVVQISSIDYSTNTITLASPMTWNDNDPIYLYKRSDGTRVLYGSAPDQGAHEFRPGNFHGISFSGGISTQ